MRLAALEHKPIPHHAPELCAGCDCLFQQLCDVQSSPVQLLSLRAKWGSAADKAGYPRRGSLCTCAATAPSACIIHTHISEVIMLG